VLMSLMISPGFWVNAGQEQPAGRAIRPLTHSVILRDVSLRLEGRLLDRRTLTPQSISEGCWTGGTGLC
jgi:hypothetical protein